MEGCGMESTRRSPVFRIDGYGPSVRAGLLRVVRALWLCWLHCHPHPRRSTLPAVERVVRPRLHSQPPAEGCDEVCPSCHGRKQRMTWWGRQRQPIREGHLLPQQRPGPRCVPLQTLAPTTPAPRPGDSLASSSSYEPWNVSAYSDTFILVVTSNVKFEYNCTTLFSTYHLRYHHSRHPHHHGRVRYHCRHRYRDTHLTNTLHHTLSPTNSLTHYPTLINTLPHTHTHSNTLPDTLTNTLSHTLPLTHTPWHTI